MEIKSNLHKVLPNARICLNVVSLSVKMTSLQRIARSLVYATGMVLPAVYQLDGDICYIFAF